nr:S24 family peptidase [Paludisphaera mucosa]
MPARTWYNYETGVTVPAEILLSFIELTGASPTYLTTGEGPRYVGPSEDRRMTDLSPLELIRRGLEKLERERPIFSSSPGSGQDGPLAPGREGTEFQAVLVFPFEELNRPTLDTARSVGRVLAYRHWLPNPGATIAVRAVDESMSPILPKGSIVAIDRSLTDPRELRGKIVAARLEGEVMIRWLDLSGRHVILRPNHAGPDHPLVPVEIDDAPADFLIGRVVWSWSRFGEG